MGLAATRNINNNHLLRQEIQNLKAEFCLENQEVYKFYHHFTIFDHDQKGYLTIDDLVNYFREGNENCVELPFLERLFKVINKKEQDKLFFEEFVVGISTFCLMNSQSILKFVFEWIDTDLDDKICKNDIIRSVSYLNPKNDQPCFFINFIPEIEKIKLKNQQILMEFEEFRQIAIKIHMLIWPAFKLQEAFHKSIIGKQFWKQLEKKIEIAESSYRTYEKKMEKNKEKFRTLKNLKIVEPEYRKLFKESLYQRVKGEASTDLNLHFSTISKKERRRSCMYLKCQFQSNQDTQPQHSI